MTPKAKICGIKTLAALDAALDGGADYIGLVFFPKSPRNLTLTEGAILAGWARMRTHVVALVVDADDTTLDAIIEQVSPGILQLHGSETPERVSAIKKRYERAIFKAIPVETAADALRAKAYDSIADMILYDAKPPKGAILPGGNGVAFDWHALASAKHPYMLSGGLNPANVAEAIRVTGASAVDVSSGVESAPGVKDPELIRAFLRAVRATKSTI